MNCNHVTSNSANTDSNNTNNNNGGTNNINNSSYTNKHSNKIQMTEPWSIPRPTLSSSASSSNSSQKSNSTPASLNRKQPKHRAATHHGRGHRNLAYQHDGTFSSNSSNEYDNSYYLHRQQRSNSKSLDELKQRFDDFNTTTRPTNGGVNYSSYQLTGQQEQQQQQKQQQHVTNIDEHDELTPTPKRGSRSSQGSSDSNNSSHSASSGSLLLTVANLENFAKIHQNTCSTGTNKQQPYSIYNTNITLPSHPEDRVADQHAAGDDTAHTIVSMAHPKTKDLDALSMASSTHFTVVNGMTGPQRVPKSGLCSRGHQITVLIVTMSMIFLIGISAAVFMLEMRARDMPQ